MDCQHLTKDRSLGYTELVVSNISPSLPLEDTQHYPFKSSGVKSFDSLLPQDGGSVFKRTLHYAAEFVPVVALKDESQNMEVNKLRSKRRERDEDGDTVTDESSSEDEDGVLAGVTIEYDVSQSET